MFSTLGSRARVYSSAASRRCTAVVFWLHSLLIRSWRIRAAQNGSSPVISLPSTLLVLGAPVSSSIPFRHVRHSHSLGQERIHIFAGPLSKAPWRAPSASPPTITMEVMIMSAQPPAAPTSRPWMSGFEPSDGDSAGRFDTSVPHPARIYGYWLGGKDYFPADRKAAEEVIRLRPQVVASARANRAFLSRVVHYLAADCGIRQFLDIGTGLPAPSNTHEVAQRAIPHSRVVYCDNDQLVLTHARALLTSTPQSACAYVDA